MFRLSSQDILIKGLITAFALLLVLSFSSSNRLLAQDDQNETEAQRLIDKADAVIYQGYGQVTPDEAQEVVVLFEEAYSLDPESFYYSDYTNWTDMYYLIGNTDRAVEIWQKLLDKHPFDPMAIFFAGNSLLEYGRLNEAEPLAYRGIVISINSNDLIGQANGYGALGKIYRQQGKNELADWADGESSSLREEAYRQANDISLFELKPKPYEYPIAVMVYLVFISLVAWADYLYRKKKGKGAKFKRDAILLCVITALITWPFVTLYPLENLISIPGAVLMFVIPQAAVLAIAFILNYRIKLSFDTRT